MLAKSITHWLNSYLKIILLIFSCVVVKQWFKCWKQTFMSQHHTHILEYHIAMLRWNEAFWLDVTTHMTFYV